MGAGEDTTLGAIEPSPPGVDGSKGPRHGFPAVTIIPFHASYGKGVLPLAFHPPTPPSGPICPFEINALLERKGNDDGTYQK
jgi:hypothetical protein